MCVRKIERERPGCLISPRDSVVAVRAAHAPAHRQQIVSIVWSASPAGRPAVPPTNFLQKARIFPGQSGQSRTGWSNLALHLTGPNVDPQPPGVDRKVKLRPRPPSVKPYRCTAGLSTGQSSRHDASVASFPPTLYKCHLFIYSIHEGRVENYQT